MGLKIVAMPAGHVHQVHDPSVTWQRGWDKTRDLPMIMFAIVGGDRPIMVDTGTPDGAFVQEHHSPRFRKSADEETSKVLAGEGIDPAEVRDVVFTHLHWDHCSNLHLFPNATFHVQDAELRYAVDPIALHRRAYERVDGLVPPWVPVTTRIAAIEGRVEIAPGVSTVALPGHTPGSQGVLVETEKGAFLLAGDNVYSYDNWIGDAAAPHIPSGSFTNLIQYTESFKVMDALGAEVIPSHDIKVLETRVFG